MALFATALFEQLPIIGILRGLPGQALRPVLEAVLEGGLTNLEITMNTPGAVDQIRTACEMAGPKLNVGAGTVTDLQLLDQARLAGASFIVTPTVLPTIIERCVQENLPVFPGALAPTEVQRAWDLGAMAVKIFPADSVGLAYFERLRVCLPEIRLMPTGGVDVNTLGRYAHAGAAAFGVGTPLFRPDRIAVQDWAWLRSQCRAFVKAYAACQPNVIN